MTDQPAGARTGHYYRPRVRGYYRFRIRETHVRDHLAPMLSANRLGAVKLDLVLRGMARLPRHLGNRPPKASVGLTLDRVEYPELYTLVTSGLAGRDEQRAWVRRHIVTLEQEHLVQRIDHPHRGHDIQVLSDRGDDTPFDDPTGQLAANDTYLTINGTLFSSGAIAHWTAPEVAFYLAAMIGEAHDRQRPDITNRGDGAWWRSDEWFADRDGSRRNLNDVRIPFSKRTLIRGRQRLKDDGYVQVGQLTRHPDTGQPFARGGRRNTYLNRFETRAVEILREAGRDLAPVPEVALVHGDL